MKAKVIVDKCIGCGQCEGSCPDVFQINDEGFATVIVENIDEKLVEDAEIAASGCPTDAIEIEKEA